MTVSREQTLERYLEVVTSQDVISPPPTDVSPLQGKTPPSLTCQPPPPVHGYGSSEVPWPLWPNPLVAGEWHRRRLLTGRGEREKPLRNLSVQSFRSTECDAPHRFSTIVLTGRMALCTAAKRHKKPLLMPFSALHPSTDSTCVASCFAVFPRTI